MRSTFYTFRDRVAQTDRGRCSTSSASRRFRSRWRPGSQYRRAGGGQTQLVKLGTVTSLQTRRSSTHLLVDLEGGLKLKVVPRRQDVAERRLVRPKPTLASLSVTIRRITSPSRRGGRSTSPPLPQTSWWRPVRPGPRPPRSSRPCSPGGRTAAVSEATVGSLLDKSGHRPPAEP